MQYYECKCGKSTAYGSMGPDRCYGCTVCGTALVNVRSRHIYDHPELHHARVAESHRKNFGDRPDFTEFPYGWQPPEPHNWYTRKVQTDEGEKGYTICKWCGTPKSEAET